MNIQIFPSEYRTISNEKLKYNGSDLECKRCLHHLYGRHHSVFQLKHDGAEYYSMLLCDDCSKNPSLGMYIVKEIKIDTTDSLTVVLAAHGVTKFLEIKN